MVIKRMSPPAAPRTTVASAYERAYLDFAASRAVITDEGVLTYLELGAAVHAVVAGLGDLGVAAGAPVVLLLPNSATFMISDHACFVGGFVRVALSTRLSPVEVTAILENCRPGAVITTEEWSAKLDGVACPVVTDVPVAGARAAVSDMVKAAGVFVPRDVSAIAPEDAASILYTSGTTGTAKGAVLSHSNWIAMTRLLLSSLPHLGTDDVVLHVAPLSHASGYYAPCFTVSGSAHLPVERFDAEETLLMVGRHAVTALPMVPTILNRLVEAAEDGQFDLSSLRMVTYGASPIAPDRVRRAIAVFGDRLYQFYGSSEAPMPLTCLPPEDHRLSPSGAIPDKLASAGRPLPFVDLRVVDSRGEPLPRGEVGEIEVRSDTVMLGYLGLPDRTVEVLDPDGWLRTGDLGRVSADGYLTIVDRKNDLIISGGFNVYPNEVEAVIMSLVGVREVAVVGVPDELWGQIVTAVVVVREGAELGEADIVARCARDLAGYKKPRRVHFVADLPKTSSGKLLRRRVLSVVPGSASS